MVASHVASTGDLACNPGRCPYWESNRGPFGSQAALSPLSYTSQGSVVIMGTLDWGMGEDGTGCKCGTCLNAGKTYIEFRSHFRGEIHSLVLCHSPLDPVEHRDS